MFENIGGKDAHSDEMETDETMEANDLADIPWDVDEVHHHSIPTLTSLTNRLISEPQ